MNILLFWKRNGTWIFFTTISIALLVILETFDGIRAVRWSAYTGIIFLMFSLLPKHILTLQLKGTQRFRSQLILLLGERRNFGITGGLLLVFHALLAMNTHVVIPPPISFVLSPPIILGTLSILIIIAMLLTSSKQSYNLLGRYWKQLHTLIWIVIPFGLIHSILARLTYANEIPLISITLFGIIIGFVGFEFVVGILRKHIPPSVKRRTLLIVIGIVIGVVTIQLR